MSETVVNDPGLGRGGWMSAGRKQAAVLRLEAKIERLEAGRPLVRRRSRR